MVVIGLGKNLLFKSVLAHCDIFILSIASHSGWEDHFSSSQFHYLHHRFFECNYGSNSSPLDKIFGTFRDKLKESGTTYRGGSEEKVDAKSAAITDSKASLNSLPDLGFSIYMLINCTIWALLGLAVTQQVNHIAINLCIYV